MGQRKSYDETDAIELDDVPPQSSARYMPLISTDARVAELARRYESGEDMFREGESFNGRESTVYPRL